jgi:conjugal transfer pilus assembly protein TraI
MLTFFTRRAAGTLAASPQAPRRGAAKSLAGHPASPEAARAVASARGVGAELAVAGAGAALRRGVRPPGDSAFVYPPVDPGLPAVAVEDIVASQSMLIARLRSAVGGDEASFAALHLAPVEALARYVHLLPASAHAHFAGAGGLFRQCLECAFFCAQSAAGRVFVASGPSAERHALEPRWRHAAFLAGLICELRQPLAESVVCDDAGREWPRFLGGLDAWIDDLGLSRYHVNWLPGARRPGHAEAAAVVGRILPSESLAWLSDGAPEITQALFAIALGQREAGDSPLGELVDIVQREVLRHEAVRRPSRYGLLRVGHHLESHLLDAIRARVECGDWHPGEEPGAMLSWREGALHLRWPEAAAVIVSDLVARGLTGIPRASGTLVDCLAMAGLLAADGCGRWVWARPGGWEDVPAGGEYFSLCFADAATVLPAFAAPQPASARVAADAPSAPKTVVPLSPEELQCVRSWQAALAERREQELMLLPDGRVAVSHAFASASHPDVVTLLRDLDCRGWLGRGDWAARGARVGLVDFPGGRQPALLLTAHAARLLGLVA